jgi:hypothetical protein
VHRPHKGKRGRRGGSLGGGARGERFADAPGDRDGDSGGARAAASLKLPRQIVELSPQAGECAGVRTGD